MVSCNRLRTTDYGLRPTDHPTPPWRNWMLGSRPCAAPVATAARSLTGGSRACSTPAPGLTGAMRAGARAFSDSPHVPSFVPNKAATACEALFLLAEVAGESSWVERYALPTLDRILAHQAHGGGSLDGAIAQNSLGRRTVETYFPIYIARCVPALLRGYRWTNDEQYAE